MPFTPEQHAEHYVRNRDKILNKQKKFYAENKDTLNRKVMCEKCYCTVSRPYLKNHQKSHKCILKSFNPVKPLWIIRKELNK